MSGLPHQFDIPTHPSCAQLSEGTKALGISKIAECKNLISRLGKRKPINLDEEIKKADEQVTSGGSASEYKAYLCKLKRKQRNGY